MRYLRHILLALATAVACVCSAPSWAASGMQQPDGVRLRTFSMSDGMPSNSVAMMSVGSNGMLWVATWNGLCNYDGYRFNNFLDLPGAKDVLHGNRIKYAYPTANGDVWLTTFDDRLFLLDASERRYVDCSEMLRQLGLDDFHVQYMEPLSDKALLIIGADHVDLIAEDGKLETAEVEDVEPIDTFTDSKGREWRLGDDGQIDSSTGGSYRCQVPESWPVIHTDTPIMLEDKSGTVWFVPTEGTLCYYDEQADCLVPTDLRQADHTLPDEIFMTQPLIDRQGNLWFRNGFNLCQLSFRDSNFKFLPVVEGAETRSIFVDASHRLWVGTRQGHLARIDDRGQSPLFVNADGRLSGVISTFDTKGVYAIHQDSRGDLWVGTRGDGVYRLTPKGAVYEVEHFTNREAGDDTGLSNIYDIREDAYGHIWMATYGGGIAYYDPDSRMFYSGDNLSGLKLPDGNINKVRRVEVTDDGPLVFSTTEGIVTLDSRFLHRGDIRVHVSRYAPGTPGALLAPDVLQTLATRRDNTVYVATLGGGLQRVEPGSLLRDDLRFRDVEHNFPNIGNIRGMVEDLRGNVWLIGENAIHCLSADESGRHTYTSNDWDGPNGFNEARPVLDSLDNRILLGTMGGIISFSPQDIKPATDVPVIVFTGIQYQGDGQQSPLLGNNEITLPTDRQNATIYFAALDYTDNLQIRYAYRIRGLDDTWNYVGSERCAPLSNLPPGRYTLEVRSTNNEGVWVDNNTEISIYIEPTFWQTPWAKALYVLLALLVVFGSIYLWWLRKRRREEKKIHERQLRLLQEELAKTLGLPRTVMPAPGGGVTDGQYSSNKPSGPSAEPEHKAADKTASDSDRKFKEDITAFISDNVENPNLKIDDVASAMHMSRTVLYGKIKAIYGVAPNDVVRSIRIARACRLLHDDPGMSVADVALAVGYTDPKYFARYFRQSMGVSPSDYRKGRE